MRHRLRFAGTGTTYFGVAIVNLLLTLFTLGLYYPWAKAARLKYVYANTLLDDSPFQFHGTGRELFAGFAKAVGVFLLLYGVLWVLSVTPILSVKVGGLLAVWLTALALIPLAMHSALLYRLSQTSWRGIRLGYRGNRNELLRLYFKEGVLTLVTLGFYRFWMKQNILRYTTSHIRFGSAQMGYTGNGTDYFMLCLKGYFLTFLTLGIYGFWWGRDLFNYYVNNLTIESEGKVYRFQSSLPVETYAWLLIGNLLLIVCTLTLGSPLATVRTMRTLLGHVLLDERLDTGILLQTEAVYSDSKGEEFADIVDLSL